MVGGLCSLLQHQFVLDADEAGVFSVSESKEDEAFGHLDELSLTDSVFPFEQFTQ